MKPHLLSTVLFSTLLVALPGHAAECPAHHADKAVQVMSVTKAPASQARSQAAPAPEVSWHDLHWLD